MNRMLLPPRKSPRAAHSPFCVSALQPASAQVVINEIHYHPVENAAFDTAGNPLLDLSSDVHEFVELFNAGPSAVDLGGWQITSGVSYTFPAGTSIAAGGYKVVARNPARLQTVYGITGVLGPYGGLLSNSGDTLKLKTAGGTVVDSVSYLSAFPWPGSADALGADVDFTLINKDLYQYKGRSLQRFSAAAAGNDPANWLASPLATGPSPGSANASVGTTPLPVVVAINVVQNADEAAVIRQNNPVRVTFTMSATTALSQVEVQYFVDDVNSYVEPRVSVPATSAGGNVFAAIIPGQADRSVVRWRVRANRGAGVEMVSPRLDDVAMVPVAATTREAWHAYFVTPTRVSPNPVYDVFISSSDPTNAAFNGLNGLAALNYNITGNPKRVTSSAPSGLPRDLPYVPATSQLWNGSVPCIFIENGNVRDAHLRYHGSRYNRSAARSSWKLRFADNQKHQGADSVFITDKGDYFSVMHGLFLNANLPVSPVRWVDWYLNNNGRTLRLEQGEYNGDLLGNFHERIQQLNPGAAKEVSGEFFKDVGTIEDAGEGPYGRGDERLLLAAGGWTTLQRYEWTYILQNHGWKGMVPFKTMIEGLWSARGDSFSAPNPNIPNLRTYLDTILDVDTELTSMAILNWSCPWDDTTQNHFLWRRANGRWAHVPWDFDAFFGNGDTTGTNSWIYLGEVGTPPAGILGNNSRGPNFFKDSVLKAYRAEYNERLWLLNNTYLHPTNLQTLFYRDSNGSLRSYYSFINGVKANFCELRFQSVNSQTGHVADGSDFTRPNKPLAVSPANASTALPPASLTTSAYSHSSGSTSGTGAHAKTKWEIREATGTYDAPVFTLTSTSSLTSLPIPFAALQFAHTYSWRATYSDAQGHPSFTSDESSFVFGPQPANQVLISYSDPWKYSAVDAFNDPTWAQPGFNDSAWSSGPGVFAFEPNGIPAPATIQTTLPDVRGPNGRATIYFRKHFNFPGNPATATVRIQHLIDDGAVIYLNGTRIHRYRMPDLAAYPYAQLSASSPGDALYVYADASPSPGDSSYLDPRPYLVQGDNVIAVEVHQTTFIAPGNSGNSSDVTFGLRFDAEVVASGGEVALNEIVADNGNAVTNGSTHPDYIELRNNTAAAMDLAGWSLSDDVLVPTKFAFPAGTVIPSGGWLVVWCDSEFTAPGLHAGFKLATAGQTVALFQGNNVRDYVTFGPQPRDLALGRVPDGAGNWSLIAPTPAATNGAALTLGAASALKINEWMANPSRGEDWFELHNPSANPVALAGLYLSDTPGSNLTQIPALSFIAGRGFSRFEADGSSAGGNHANFKLGSAGDSLILTAATGATTIDSVTFGAQALDVSQGRLPDGAAALASFAQTATPGASNYLPAPIVINEALTNSTPPLEDVIELYNPTSNALNLTGWWLSDDSRSLQKFQLPAGTTIAAGGYLLISESQFNSGANAFSLSSTGDEIVLSAIDGGGALTGFRAQVAFGAAADGVPFGRVLTGSPVGSQPAEFWPLTGRTFRKPQRRTKNCARDHQRSDVSSTGRRCGRQRA